MARKNVKPTRTATTAPVAPANLDGALPEFATLEDTERLFGLSRGSIYNLINLGKIKSVCLRITGNASGRRLIDCASVRSYIAECQATAEAA